MNEIVTSGLIFLKSKQNIEFAVCRIDYHLYEDETFKYVFTPDYGVIDLLDSYLFDGIPGLNLDLRKREYIRENIIPVFISERVPSENREDYHQLLESVGMTYLNPIEYLIKTPLVYSGDEFYIKEYTDKKEIDLASDVGKSNSLRIIKIILDHLAKGDTVKINNKLLVSSKSLFDTLLYIYSKGSEDRKKKQQEGIDLAKKKHVYKGRKPIHVDRMNFLKQLERVNKGEITSKEAADILNISIDKYYRMRKQVLKEK